MSKLQDRLAGKTAAIGRQKGAEQTDQQAPGANAPSPASAPPAAASRAPGPVTMPGQLGAFRQEALRYVEQIKERDAKIAELEASTDRVQSIQLSLVDDSPFQPRLEYDPEEIDALAKTMAAGSQADPIKVRKVGERYELISGHRRKRAALSLGWTEIDAIVENRSDDEAELESMLLVVGSVLLSDYEYAKMYRRALDKNFCKTQQEAANLFGVSQPKVSGCLEMLSLPAPILEMLDAKPSLFSYTTGKEIKALLKEHPKHVDIVVKGVRRLVEESAKQNGLKGWILQAIAQATHKAKPRENTLVITKEGHQVFTTKKSGNAVTVNIKAQGVDDAQFEKDLHQWLNEYAAKNL